MATPLGEDSWLAYLDETVRNASDLEKRVNTVEIHKRAVGAEPGSLRLWLSYCNYFWSLWEHCQSPTSAWSEEDQIMGRELFSFGAALDLWQQGYEAIKYRLDDSHHLWDRWISLEMDLLSKTKTPDGIKRITHLYRNRLLTPHLRWDDTSQSYSSFLSEYNRPVWEDSMKEITSNAQEVKRLIAARDPFELKLNQAVRAGDVDAQKSIFSDYLEWEMRQSKRNNDNPDIGMDICCGLYARALTGIFASDENTWHEYITFLSSSVSDPQAPKSLLDVLSRAVQHCPWSGQLWNRYILCAEEAKLAFVEVESIKHAATSEDQLYKNGMESMIEMYVAWCGFLKRTAMEAGAGDEAVDVADVGLPAAIEDVSVAGKRLYGKDFQGDPKFRLERIYIQYLTEKKGAIDEARNQWNKLASSQINADNHDFWFRYYMWEMLIFSSKPGMMRSPTPTSAGAGFRVPTLATTVLTRAVARPKIDWPEKVLEVYMQHCNDYEPPNSVRRATDRVHKTAKEIRRRREREQKDKEEAYAAYYGTQQPEVVATDVQSIAESNRKRDLSQLDAEAGLESATKRQKNESSATHASQSAINTSHQQQEAQARDRENATVIVENLPGDVTQTKVRQYFKEYGHINNITALVRDQRAQASSALIEFSTPEEAKSALLRNGKYFGQSQLSVASGHDMTIYVTNYPPAADEKYIRDLFKECGEILSVRWPSLKVNTHRRFCYISFRNREASARAVQQEGTVLDGKYRLQVKYSDPSQRKKREGAVAEGREVHITNLDRTASETELSQVFAKYGAVKRVNIPQTFGGKNRGFAFLDFETKDQAQEAVAELNNTKFRNQILQVEISKESKVKPSARSINPDRDSESPAPSRDAEGDEGMGNNARRIQDKPSAEDIKARTIALMGLPDTVNDARVRALLEPMGTILKLVLQPSHGGAKIEFADTSTAGKAALQLDSMEFEGHKLRTGSLEEFRHAKPARDDNKSKGSAAAAKHLVPPPAIRRPGTLKPGRKRGLGFVGARKATENPPNGSESSNNKTAPKSNADFKAMFLSSNEKKTEGEKETKTVGENGA